MVPDMEYAMQQSQQALSTAEMQVATGRRVNQLSDDPSASASMVVSLTSSANVDQYTSNVGTLSPQLQTADSAISQAITVLNTAITLGTEGANGTNTAQRPVIATQVAGVLSTVIAQANASYGGVYLFGGSASSTPPFVAASTTYTSANVSDAAPLSAATALTAGSITTISDATTGGTFRFTAQTGDTIGTLQAAIVSAVSAGTLTAGTTATIDSSGQLSIATNSSTAGIVVSSNDAVLGSMSAASAYNSANGSAASPLSASTALTAGSVTTISDAQTGDTFRFTAKTGDTIGTLQTAIASAVSAGTLTSGTAATIDSSGQLSIATNSSAAGIVVSSNDAVLGSMSAASGTEYNSANSSAAAPLSAATELTAGSITTIGDATTGDTFEFTAQAGDTIGTLQTKIANAVTAGTLSAGTTATINASGQFSISTNSSTAGIAVVSNDAALGSMSATSGTAVANAYAYVGNNTVNTAQVGDALSVATNVPGSNLFGSGSNVIGALSALISALQNGGATDQIGTAVTAVSTAVNNVNQQRVPLDNTISELNSQESYLGQETITLSTQQTALVGVDIATAATNLAQAQTQNQAVLAVAAKVLPQTLLNYLSQPSA
jgi:flagellin-like hook-associated protein FlgL